MHTTHTLSVIITHYKRMGYVIIHKPNCSGREGINSRCRRFDLLPFHHFGSTSRRYDRSCRRSGSVCSMGRCRPTVTQLPPLFGGSLAINRAGRWFMQINTRASDTVSASFSRIKKLLARTETRSRERMDLRSIQTVYVSRETIEQELRPAVW